jgi:hypothetical protein
VLGRVMAGDVATVKLDFEGIVEVAFRVVSTIER